RRAEAQWHLAVADRRRLVHHRPLVHAEAVQSRRARGRRAKQAGDEPHGLDTREQVLTRHGHTLTVTPVTAAIEIAVCRRACERHAETGVPDPQLPGPQAVVGEQEIPYRVGLARLRPPAMGQAELVDPFL